MARSSSNKTPYSSHLGFTLIEITFALLILSSALSVILGMQAAAINRTYHDQMEQQAMLLARRLLSSVESSSSPIEIETLQDSGDKILEVLTGAGPHDETEGNSLKRFNVSYVVTYQGIPKINEKAMKKISLDVSWGDSDFDRCSVVFFIPNGDEIKSEPG